MPTAGSPDDLSAAALAARERAYSPYSGYAVGAALRDEHGRIHAAPNVENAAYPQSQCAEASAIGVLIAAGGRRVTGSPRRRRRVASGLLLPVRRLPAAAPRVHVARRAAPPCRPGRRHPHRHARRLLPLSFGPEFLLRQAMSLSVTGDPGTPANQASPAIPASPPP